MTRPGAGSRTSWSDYVELSERQHWYTVIAAFDGGSRTLTGNGPADRLPAVEVTASFFDVLGVAPSHWTRIRAVRRRIGRRPCCHPVERRLEAAARRRRVGDRPHAHAEWHAPHRHRHPAAGIHLSTARRRRSLAAAAAVEGAAGSPVPPLARHRRAPPRRRDGGPGAPGVAGDRRRVAEARRVARVDRASPRVASGRHRRGRAPGDARAERRGAAVAAGRRHERVGSHPVARRGPRGRARCPCRTRRDTLQAAASAGRRIRLRGLVRHGARPAARQLGGLELRGDGSSAISRVAAVRRHDRRIAARRAVHAALLLHRRHRCEHRSSMAERRPARAAGRRQRADDAGTRHRAAADDAGRRADRAGGRAAGRSGADRAQRRAADARVAGLRPARADHGAAVAARHAIRERRRDAGRHGSPARAPPRRAGRDRGGGHRPGGAHRQRQHRGLHRRGTRALGRGAGHGPDSIGDSRATSAPWASR